METVTISLQEFERMQRDLKILKNLKLYKRLLEFEKHIASGNRYNREDLGF